MAKRDRAAWIREAAHHHTNLCLFGSVVAIMESGNIHGPRAQADAALIIRRCNNAMRDALYKYDNAVAQAQKADEK